MASSGKSKQLGLSLWEAADRPERLDFLQDNQNLEATVGGHLANSLLHLTTGEKAFVKNPYRLYQYTGTGGNSLTLSGLAAVPKMVVVFCSEYPPCMPREDGKVDVYWDYWVKSNTDERGYCGGGGVVLTSWNSLYFYNVSGERLVRNLNQKGLHYNALCLGSST